MAAYIVFTVTEVTNPELMGQYQERAPRLLASQGHSLVAGPLITETLEGPPAVASAAIRFDSVDAARDWYFSPEYQELVAIRDQASKGSVFILEGA